MFGITVHIDNKPFIKSLPNVESASWPTSQ